MTRAQRIFLIISFCCIMGWSVYRPADKMVWVLEALPVIIGAGILWFSHRRFQWTPLAYQLFWLASLLILIGAHYTYGEMPLFNWLRDEMGASRNHYDRFGHFFQGAISAIVFREILLRTSPLRPGRWLFAIVTGLCLAMSAFYELAEWITSAVLGYSANEFLGLQGDEWDAQKDMALAMLGAIIAQSIFAGRHDRQLSQQASRA